MAIRVELELDDGNFTSRVLHAGDTLQKFEQNVGQGVAAVNKLNDAGSSLLSTFRDISVVFGGLTLIWDKASSVAHGFIGEIVKVNMEMERLQALLRSMSRAADPVKEAADQMKYLRDFAQNAPFALETLTSTFKQLKAAGIDPMTGSMKALTDGVAAMGGSDHVLKSTALAISEMAGKGVIEMKELRRQLGQAVPDAMELMARSMGVTMQQLAKETRTGTIQAKEALENFWNELERVHGGADERLMDTLAGQAKKITAAFQNLQLRAGKNGFMDALQTQMEDINHFLAGNAAGHLADMVGSALTKLVGMLRSGVETLIGFRNEIVDVGKAIAIAFSGRLAIAGITGLIGWFGKLREEISLFSMQWAVMKNEMALNNMIFASRNPLVGVTTSVNGLGVAAMNAGVMMRTLASGFGVVAPYLPIIAGGIMLVADYFDIFGKKAHTAWEELEQFGATSRKQAEEAGGTYIKMLENRLKALEGQQATRGFGFENESGADYSGEIAKLREELARAREAYGKHVEEGTAADAERNGNRIVKSVRDQLNQISIEYDIGARKAEQASLEVQNTLNKAGQSSKAERERLSAELRQKMIEDEEKSLQIIRTAIDAQEEVRANAANEAQRRDAMLAEDGLMKLEKEHEKRLKYAQEHALQVNKGVKPIDDEKLFQKGEDALAKLQAETEGLKATLAGANGEVVALFEILERGKYGDAFGVDDVKQLIAQLIEVKRQHEEINSLIEGRKKLEGDLANARTRAEQQTFEAEHKGISEIDKIMIRVKNGMYQGFGPNQTEAQRHWLELADAIRSTTTLAEMAGRTFAETTFGGSAKTAVEGFLTTSREIATTWGFIGSRLAQAGAASSGLGNIGAASGGGRFALTGAASTAPGGGIGGGFKSEDDLVVRTVLGEAGNQIKDGVIGVMEVIKNRVADGTYGGRTATDVVMAHDSKGTHQFSLWNSGNKAGAYARSISEDDPKYQEFMELWQAVKNGDIADPTGGARNYYNPRAANPDWGPSMQNQRQIGDHLFGTAGYKKKRPEDPSGYIDPTLPSDIQMDAREGMFAEQRANEAKAKRAVQDAMDEANAELLKLGIMQKGLAKNRASAVEKIANSQLDSAHPDPNDPFWKPYLSKMDEVDAEQKKADDFRKKRGKAESASDTISRYSDDDATRENNARAGVQHPDDFRHTERYLNVEQSARKNADAMKDSYGEGSEEYKNALDKAQAHKDANTRIEVLKDAEKWARENEMAKDFFRTQGQQEANSLQHKIAQIDSEVQAFTAAGGKDVEVTRQAEEKKRLLRQEALMKHPLAQQLAGYGDVFKNLEADSTKWLSSFNDNLATALTHGKVNWKSFAQQIMTDLAKIGLQLAESQLFKMLMSGMGMGGAGGEGGLFSGLGRMFGIAHTGGILGETNLAQRYADPMIFAGAPRFHTGGIIGADEVPIIARKGEGVFTEEQMSKMGGAYMHAPISVNIHAPVNATGGSPEQNADLAKQLSSHLETVARGVVVDEIRKQQRPGNLLNQ